MKMAERFRRNLRLRRKILTSSNRNLLFLALSAIDYVMEIGAVRKFFKVFYTFLILCLSFAIVVLLGVSSLFLLNFIATKFGEGIGWLAVLAVVIFFMALVLESYD